MKGKGAVEERAMAGKGKADDFEAEAAEANITVNLPNLAVGVLKRIYVFSIYSHRAHAAKHRNPFLSAHSTS